MMSVARKKAQREVLQEFVQAQHTGFVTKIDMVLGQERGKIIYEPSTATYRNNEYCETECKTYTDDLTDVPVFSILRVHFSETVANESIEKIKSYLVDRYECVCKQEKNVLMLSEISYVKSPAKKSQ